MRFASVIEDTDDGYESPVLRNLSLHLRYPRQSRLIHLTGMTESDADSELLGALINRAARSMTMRECLMIVTDNEDRSDGIISVYSDYRNRYHSVENDIYGPGHRAPAILKYEDVRADLRTVDEPGEMFLLLHPHDRILVLTADHIEDALIDLSLVNRKPALIITAGLVMPKISVLSQQPEIRKKQFLCINAVSPGQTFGPEQPGSQDTTADQTEPTNDYIDRPRSTLSERIEFILKNIEIARSFYGLFSSQQKQAIDAIVNNPAIRGSGLAGELRLPNRQNGVSLIHSVADKLERIINAEPVKTRSQTSVPWESKKILIVRYATLHGNAGNNPQEAELIRLIKNNPEISLTDIARRIGKSKSAAFAAISKLVKRAAADEFLNGLPDLENPAMQPNRDVIIEV
ncbi:hypothetical protein A2Z33_00430 [Candidatus Gottesmanbacteria bacterium RBG_16_52_11]|uniref:Uncharacterized protein n=1 Tax=Candidatus Gottesmanbacteria bacterium RBG_16_52_11 TaxID=1798374 RepID=A0A1F5YMX7_9BACT|nr:MAG: hypothetical protein A2Z33_00430 [Candidatus Gottesmanbacteria bacterium RBG_16_52_11]